MGDESDLKNYGMADIHIHSSVGDGMADIPELLNWVERETKLDVIAITDHDDIKGSYQARELVEKGNYRFDTVIGMEVTTRQGHLLALFLEKPVPSLQSLMKTIEAIHNQGGLCIVPHPMSWLTYSVGQRLLDKIAASRDPGIYLDGIEIINSTIAGRVCRGKAKRLNEMQYGLAETGGSDAHFLTEVGSGYTLFEGRTAADLRQSLIRKTTRAGGGTGMRLSRIGYGQIIKQLLKGLLLLPSRRLTKRLRGLFI